MSAPANNVRAAARAPNCTLDRGDHEQGARQKNEGICQADADIQRVTRCIEEFWGLCSLVHEQDEEDGENQHVAEQQLSTPRAPPERGEAGAAFGSIAF